MLCVQLTLKHTQPMYHTADGPAESADPQGGWQGHERSPSQRERQAPDARRKPKPQTRPRSQPARNRTNKQARSPPERAHPAHHHPHPTDPKGANTSQNVGGGMSEAQHLGPQSARNWGQSAQFKDHLPQSTAQRAPLTGSTSQKQQTGDPPRALRW